MGKILVSNKKRSTQFMAVFVTVPTPSDADLIGSQVVKKGLAACANVIPGITSIYKWKGKIEKGNEVLIMFKTASSRYQALEQLVRRLHRYDIPEVIGVGIDCGFTQYLEWISQNVTISRGRNRGTSPRGRG